MSRRTACVLLVAICALAAGLMFARLGHAMFWVDEADTACVSRNILTCGWPVSWHNNFLVEAPVTKYARGFVWNQHPWAMLYLMAGSFAVFGATPLAARLPFALMGVLTVWLTYLLARRAGASRGAALTAAVLLALNVQFVLFARQARYFVMMPFFTVVLFLGYLRLDRRWGPLILVLGAVGLFHAHYLTFFPLGGALWLWTLLFNRKVAIVKRLAVSTIIILLLTVPWMFLADVLGKRELMREFTAAGFAVEVKEYAAKFNRRVFPAVFGVIILVLAACGRRRHLRFYGLVLLSLVAGVLFVVPVSVVRSLRYLVGFFPLLTVCAALMFEDLWRWRAPVAAVACVLFISTHLWSAVGIVPSIGLRKAVGYRAEFKNAYLRRDLENKFFRTEYADLYLDLRYGFAQDPLAHFIRLVRADGREGDLVVTPRYSNQVAFYTHLPAMSYYNWQSEQDKGFAIPEGYLRSPEGFGRVWYMKMPSVPLKDFERWVERGRLAGRLRVTRLPSSAPDIAVGNDPDLDTRLDTRERLGEVPRVTFYLIQTQKDVGRTGAGGAGQKASAQGK